MRGVSCLPRNLDCVTSPKNLSSFSQGNIYLRCQTYFWQKFVQDVLTLLCSIISNVQHPVTVFLFERISVESRNYFPPGLFTTADLTGDRRLPYGFFFLQNDSSCLFPTGQREPANVSVSHGVRHNVSHGVSHG